MGGVAVLAGNFLLGDALDNALTPGPQAAVSWLLLAVFPLCSALAMAVLCRFYAPKG
ncbi:Transporter, MFS superfamily [Cronobacter sakazakii 696]|nr:Transporter, MFS superfamily [Cronobacter sakazakii 696]